MVWYPHLLKNFPQFVVIHTVKGFGIINKAVDIFLELSCFFDGPTSKIYNIVSIIFIGVSSDWYATLDMLKESCRIASSVNWSDVDLSQFQGEY